jgi:hypothetical protein
MVRVLSNNGMVLASSNGMFLFSRNSMGLVSINGMVLVSSNVMVLVIINGMVLFSSNGDRDRRYHLMMYCQRGSINLKKAYWNRKVWEVGQTN